MNKGIQKSQWKWLLFISAAIVFVLIMVYSNKLIKNIAQEERERVEIWAGAISYKAQIVNETEAFFNSIRVEESNNAKILARAIRKVTAASFDEDITFYTDIISMNTSVPLIVAEPNGNITAAVNVPDSVAEMKNVDELGAALADYDSVILPYYGRHFV